MRQEASGNHGETRHSRVVVIRRDQTTFFPDVRVYNATGVTTSAYGAVMPTPRLVTTSELARALGLHTRTIQRYRAEGVITPEIETPGGHGRWDIEKVKQQLRDLRQRGDD
jgi:MerR-like DNA binding protein